MASTSSKGSNITSRQCHNPCVVDVKALLRQAFVATLNGAVTPETVAGLLGKEEVQALPGIHLAIADVLHLVGLEVEHTGSEEQGTAAIVV